MQPWSQELRPAHVYLRKRWYPEEHSQDQVGKTKVPSARYKFLPATQEAGSALSLQVDANPASQRHPSAQLAHCQWPFLAWHLMSLNLPANLSPLPPKSASSLFFLLYCPSWESSVTSAMTWAPSPGPGAPGPMLICLSHLNWGLIDHFKNCLGENLIK